MKIGIVEVIGVDSVILISFIVKIASLEIVIEIVYLSGAVF